MANNPFTQERFFFFNVKNFKYTFTVINYPLRKVMMNTVRKTRAISVMRNKKFYCNKAKKPVGTSLWDYAFRNKLTLQKMKQRLITLASINSQTFLFTVDSL